MSWSQLYSITQWLIMHPAVLLAFLGFSITMTFFVTRSAKHVSEVRQHAQRNPRDGSSIGEAVMHLGVECFPERIAFWQAFGDEASVRESRVIQ